VTRLSILPNGSRKGFPPGRKQNMRRYRRIFRCPPSAVLVN
jgi:hypothetical protein